MSTILSPAARLRLVRRVVPILTDAIDAAVGRHEPSEPILEAFAHRLATRGIAATAGLLEDLVDDARDLYAFQYGGAGVERWVDVERFHGTYDEAGAWFVNRLERNIRSTERKLTGA